MTTEYCKKYPELCEDLNINITELSIVPDIPKPKLKTMVKPKPRIEPMQPRAEPTRTRAEPTRTRAEPPQPIPQPQPILPNDPYTRYGVKKGLKEYNNRVAKYIKSIESGTELVEHTEEEVLNAILSESSYRNAFKSTNAAERFVKSKSHLIPELQRAEVIRDPKYTNNNHIAYKIGDKYYLAFRGSDGNFFDPEANAESVFRGKGLRAKNIADWGTNVHTLAGKEHLTERYKDAVETTKQFMKEYKLNNTNFNTTGHSLAGGVSDHVSEELGTKSVSYEAARNPLAKRPVHPNSRIKSYSTYFDPVSIARNLHAKITGSEPPHIEHKNYYSVVGGESDVLDHHDLNKQHVEPVVRTEDGKLLSKRTTALRNTSGLIGGKAKSAIKGLGEIGGLALPLFLTPDYATKGETRYRKGEAFVDNAFITASLAENLFRINPAFALIDTPAMYGELMQIDPILPPEAKRYIQKQLGIKVKEPEPFRYEEGVLPNWMITKERLKENRKMEIAQQNADEMGIPLAEYLELQRRVEDKGTELQREDRSDALVAAAERGRLVEAQKAARVARYLKDQEIDAQREAIIKYEQSSQYKADLKNVKPKDDLKRK